MQYGTRKLHLLSLSIFCFALGVTAQSQYKPIIDMSDAQDIFVNETFTLGCSLTTRITILPTLHWTYPNKYKIGSRITENKNFSFVNGTNLTIGNYVSSISVREAQTSDSGLYMCSMKSQNIETERSEVIIIVHDIKAPLLNKTNMNGTSIQVITGSLHEFFCYANGVPFPTVTWKKNGTIVDSTNMSRVELMDRDQKLKIRRVLKSDAGFYECLVMNRGGDIAANATLEILKGDVTTSDDTDKRRLDITLIAITIGAVILILCMLISSYCYWLRYCYKKERELDEELETISDYVSNTDCNIVFDPKLPIADQIDLLPYKHAWEFPKERLKLGKILGQGVFGRVVKAKAIGLVNGQASATVAVKMLKEYADREQRKALIDELKILIHIGKHLNIVNLLGAVTKNLPNGQLYVIVEYCCYGNLRHYLLKHKESFIDQLDHRTGQIDTKISSPLGSAYTKNEDNVISYSNMIYSGIGNSSHKLQSLHYVNISHNEVTNDSEKSVSVFSNPLSSFVKKSSPISSAGCGTDDTAKKNRFSITTCDLVSFAFQCARGMQYLESKKLIHRDLAARNVLLAKDNIVKICDFGLAKDCYKYSKYIKKSDGLLPLKWLAIESIRDRVFTTKSDVWSFGILLWEMFTLGGNPYPGIPMNEEFFKKLNRGYRMGKPDNAPDSIYNLMKSCWLDDPNQRPDFNDLVESIGTLLESSIRKHYVKLDAPYQMMNKEILNNDYLLMTGQPKVEYTIMTDSSQQQHYPDNQNPVNTYENVTSLLPIGKVHVPRDPMKVGPTIQSETISKLRSTISQKERKNVLKLEESIEFDGPIENDTTYLNMEISPKHCD